MIGRAALGVAAIALAAAPARGDLTFGVQAGWGHGRLPAGYGASVTTELVLHDQGGTMSMIWHMAALGAVTPGPHVEKTGESTACTYDDVPDGVVVETCTTYAHYKVTPLTDEELAQWDAYNAGADERIRAVSETSGRFFSSELRVALPYAGGSVTGGYYEWLYHLGAHGLWGLRAADLGVGIAGGLYRFDDVDVPNVAPDGTRTVVADRGYWGFGGVPIRATGFLSRRLALRLEYDLNFVPAPVGGSVLAAGLELRTRRWVLSAQASGRELRPGGLTYAGGVARVF